MARGGGGFGRRGRSNLIGCRGIGAGVSSQAGQLLLHAEVGALAHAEEGGGHGQRHQDEEHAEDGEQQELARLHPGLLHHGDLSQAAPLEETKERRLSMGRENWKGGEKKKKKKGHTSALRFFFFFVHYRQDVTWPLPSQLTSPP